MKLSASWQKLKHGMRTALALSVMAVGVSWLVLTGPDFPAPEGHVANAQQSGWGSESLAELQQGLQKISPIAMANACGMGASSCFKCHNGKRAKAPQEGKWHVNHKKVNGSCVGCHKGNPRLMKEDLSHTGLLKTPKDGVEACGNCHKADRAALEAKYK